MAASVLTKTPTAAAAGADTQPAPRPPAGPVVAPLNTFEFVDLAPSAEEFDKWLRKISHDYVTLERLKTVAGTLPVLGSIMAFADTVSDIATIVEKMRVPDLKDPLSLLDWAGMGINLIGMIPGPTAAARMTLRPALTLVRTEIRAGREIGEAIIGILASALNAKIMGELQDFVAKAVHNLAPILNSCADTVDALLDHLADLLRACCGEQDLFAKPKVVAPAQQVHHSMWENPFNSMLAAWEDGAKEAANWAVKEIADHLPPEAKVIIHKVIEHFGEMKVKFRASIEQLVAEGAVMGIMWLVGKLLLAIERKKGSAPPPAPEHAPAAGKGTTSTPPKKSASAQAASKAQPEHQTAIVPADKGTTVTQSHKGHEMESSEKVAPAKADPNGCKACPAPTSSPRSISFAMGSETFTHTDFSLHAPLPIEWSRTYRSNLGAYDQASQGARWLTPYSTRIDVRVDGRKRQLVFHGGDGRSHVYPWLEIGASHRDKIEEVTLTRVDAKRLRLDFGKVMPQGQPSTWSESYELVETCKGKAARQGPQHFRLASQRDAQGASIELHYELTLNRGACVGEQVLTDVLSRQGGQTIAQVRVHVNEQTGHIRELWEIRDGQPVRRLAAYEHDDQGDLVRAQDENTGTWDYAYRAHLVTRYTDRTGRGINLQYDHYGEPDAEGQPRDSATAKAWHEWADDGSFDTRMEWDLNRRLTYVTDALGQEMQVWYDILGYPYRIIHPDQRQEWFFRDRAKNVTRHMHPDGTTDDYVYDQSGNLVTHIRQDKSRIHFEYDTSHRLVGILDADSNVWRRGYDPQGRLEEEIDPLGRKTEYAYDKAGRPVKVTDAKGGVKKLAYTPGGQLASYTDCSGRTTTWTYDARGRLVQQTDAADNATSYRYTAPGREVAFRKDGSQVDNFPGQLEAVVHADRTEEHLVHDAEGRLLRHTDALKRETAFDYTVAGQVRHRIDAAGRRLDYRWDKLGRLTELRNENGQPYSFRYDPVGRLLEEIGFDGKATQYHYDADTGRLTDVVEGASQTRLAFDGMGRLTRREAQVGDGAVQTESFAYYPSGRLFEAANEHAKLQWFYDAVGNCTREHHHLQGPFFPTKRTAVWHHRHDELNQRIGTTRPDGHTLEWLTYGSGHVHGLMLDGDEVVSFERDDLHREIQRTQGNGLQQRQTFDAMSRLTEQYLAPVNSRPPGDLTDYQQWPKRQDVGTAMHLVRHYHYDKAGQLTVIEDSRRQRLSYAYDPVGRLLEAQSRLGRELFAFDPAGNMRPGRSEPDAPAKDTTWQGSNGRLPAVLDNLLREYAGTHYRYDERGNLVERMANGLRSEFEWDGFNRMTRAVTPTATTTFAYDALGRRLVKHSEERSWDVWEESVPTKPVTTVFGWDGDVLAYESRIQTGIDRSHDSTVHYVHEAGSFVPLLQARRETAMALPPTTDMRELVQAYGGYRIETDPLWNGTFEVEPQPFSKDEIVFYQCDHLGTPQEMTDHEGQVAWAAEYKAWGEAKIAISGAAQRAGLKNPIRFQGQYLDDETGLHYNRHRYYDPLAGKFTSRDPIKLWGGTNVHVYAPNSIHWIDPLGLANTTDGQGNSVPLNSLGIPSGAQFEPKPTIATPYARVSGCGPTAAQTQAVQGVPCVVCGTVAPQMVADHKDALVVEYYRDGQNNVATQSSVAAVQSHCPLCSRRQGGMASGFSKSMKCKLGLK